MNKKKHIAIIGGGFCGLSAAIKLCNHGYYVTVLECDSKIGGLAGSFEVNGAQLEKFYHHWFTNDEHVMNLISKLGLNDRIILRSSRTGIFLTNKFFKLSSPIDLLKFSPLKFIDRIRLGLLALKARSVKDWHQLETITAQRWLKDMGGKKVFEVVWEPLLRGKFGRYASEISAVWMWNKLKLRGGSRDRGGKEQLAYFKGGFSSLLNAMVEYIKRKDGQIITNTKVTGLKVENGRVISVRCETGEILVDAVIATPALPLIAEIVKPHVDLQYFKKLNRIQYLANICFVFELQKSLSETYWLNVNDPSFPFVGVIEHTNFEPPETYNNVHIIYLSRYLPDNEDLFKMSDDEALEYTLPFLQRMFPEFKQEWIIKKHVWRSLYSQPVVEKNYSQLIPSRITPIENFYIASMAQIYPEDRGTNYAIYQGENAAEAIIHNKKNK